MKQRGFTLMELLVVVAVVGLLVPILATIIYQISRQTVDNSNRMSAMRPLANAGRWLSEDIPMAQDTNLIVDDTPFSTLQLYWTNWSDTGNVDTYSADTVAYKRCRITYERVGNTLHRTVATCANQDETDVKCVSEVVTGASWTNDTRWVDGEPVLNTDLSFNTDSRASESSSPASIARDVSDVGFSKSGSKLTIDVAADPDGTGQYERQQTFTICGALLESEAPVS